MPSTARQYKRAQTAEDFEDIPKETRIQNALHAIRQGTTGQSRRRICDQWGVSVETVRHRLNGTKARQEGAAELQTLSPGAELALERYVRILYHWGWPCPVFHVRAMAEELHRAAGGNRVLGVNWIADKFLRRHPLLKSKIASPMSCDRVHAETPERIQPWFDLYARIKEELQIEDKDVYNMDEKGAILGATQKTRSIIPKYEKSYFSQPSNNKELATVIECVSADGRALSSWIIFKGKFVQPSWTTHLKHDPHVHFAISDSGWTDNELGRMWIERLFDVQTREQANGRWRMLIVDGHDSHVSTEVIEFACLKKIALLCLPAHLTQKLQPLDVSLFGPLSEAYKKNILKSSVNGAVHNITKPCFINFFEDAKWKSFTTEHIRNSFALCGLLPFNPDIVLSTLRKPPEDTALTTRAITPPDQTIPSGITAVATLTTGQKTRRNLLTPVRHAMIEPLFELLHEGKAALPEVKDKLKKALQYHESSKIISEATLVRMKKQYEEEREKKGGKFSKAIQGARYLSIETLNEQRAKDYNTQMEREMLDLLKMGTTKEWLPGNYMSTIKIAPRRALSPATKHALKAAVDAVEPSQKGAIAEAFKRGKKHSKKVSVSPIVCSITSPQKTPTNDIPSPVKLPQSQYFLHHQGSTQITSSDGSKHHPVLLPPLSLPPLFRPPPPPPSSPQKQVSRPPQSPQKNGHTNPRKRRATPARSAVQQVDLQEQASEQQELARSRSGRALKKTKRALG